MAPLVLSPKPGYRLKGSPPPLGIRGLWQFGEVWGSIGQGPTFDDYISGSGRYEYLSLAAAGRPAAGTARADHRLGQTDHRAAGRP